MINNILTNLVYLFYPRNISFQKEEDKYYNSAEHKRLLEKIEYFSKDENKDICYVIKNDFEKDNILKNLRIVDLLDWQDRSITFNLSIIENDELYTISLYLSILIPFYVIRVQKNKIEFFFSTMEINQMKNDNKDSRKIKDLIFQITSTIEDKMLYSEFPNALIGLIVEDVSFQEISFGKFNMFNAFFNNSTIDEI
jgi:hypothetical protein